MKILSDSDCTKTEACSIHSRVKKNIARVLGIQEGQVNVKATTEEGLGFTGEGLGISASAVCLLSEIQNYVGADVLMEDRGCAGCGGCARFGGIQK